MPLKRLCWIFLFQIWLVYSSHSCFAGASSDQTQSLDSLFRERPKSKNPATHTFIFFIQGAADHYVPESVEDIDGKWGWADARDMQQIKALSKNCRSCNVVALHIQLGGARWYTGCHSRATYLRVYSRGEKLLSRHVAILNGADPQVLTRLLQASRSWFQNSQLHLVYRGHGFYPDYVPGKDNGVAPFDLNFPESPYGVGTFVQSISNAKANLSTIGTLGLAACEMRRPEVVGELSHLATSIVATDQIVVETLDQGFNYGFLVDVRDSDHPEDVAKRMNMSLFDLHF